MHVAGEKVRHRGRPEWGIGTITKVETVTLRGQRDQRIWIRFPNAGLKTVLGSLAELEPGDAAVGAHGVGAESATLVAREAQQESGWLGAIAKRQPEEAMTSLPAQATDPFLPPLRRVAFLLGLYRFEPTGGKLIDWAVAQSGLDDPLRRFSRHELERFFERWAFERDLQLGRQVQEARRAGLAVDPLLRTAPPSAQRVLQRLDSPPTNRRSGPI